MSMIVSRAPGWEPPKKPTPPTKREHGTAQPVTNEESGTIEESEIIETSADSEPDEAIKTAQETPAP